MIDRDLRNILFIKSIEETDLSGEVIPMADRATAAREALREGGAVAPLEPTFAWTAEAGRVLATRSDRLLRPLLTRYPFLRSFLALLEGSSWIVVALVACCLMLGAALSAVDGDNRIDVLDFPLLLLVAWNLLVYTLLAVHAVRAVSPASRNKLAAGLYGRWITAGAQRLLAQSSRFNAPLTAALQRFVAEWLRVARPALLARGTGLFHLGSACVASGLVGALYFQGIGRGYRAGWDSTWPDLVPPLLHAFYGPAAGITHIALPSPARLEAMRWSTGSGEPAAPWIHLMAVTALLFIIGPRLLLAAGSWIRIWKAKRSAPMPASLRPYYSAALGAAGLPLGRGIVSVIPYSYEPSLDAMTNLRALLSTTFGNQVAVDARPTVAYGQEEKFLSSLPAQQDSIAVCWTLLMNLAATPEDENHGVTLVGLRDWLARSPASAQLLVMIDEGPYAARMAGAPERLAERRGLWRRFLQDRGIKGALVDLRTERGTVQDDAARTALVRDALSLPGHPAS